MRKVPLGGEDEDLCLVDEVDFEVSLEDVELDDSDEDADKVVDYLINEVVNSVNYKCRGFKMIVPFENIYTSVACQLFS